MSLDIHTAVQTTLILAALAVLILIWGGIRSIRNARNLKFFRMRRDRMMSGWRMLFFSVTLILFILALKGYGEPAIYKIFPPTATLSATPTDTLTPTVTLTPTITLTPTATDTPSVTESPTVTPTPHVPLAVEAQFQSTTTPSPDSIFSPLIFAEALDKDYNPVNPSTTFQNPVGHLFAYFTYDKMTVGVQWTALWYRQNELVFFETKPWDGAIGGRGYTDWNPQPEEWLPGEYQVQIFVGMEFKVAGIFTVEGQPPTQKAPPTATTTPTATSTLAPSSTPGPSRTPVPTQTPIPSQTPVPTKQLTATPSPTLRTTPTPTIENTHAPTITPSPPKPTATRAPTATEIPQ